MSSSFERYLRRLRDPRWIPHISSYCDVRCHRCAFSTRCWSFAVQQGLEPRSPEDVEPEDDEFEPKTPRRPGWAERHNIDVGDFEMSSADRAEYDAREQRIENDALGKRAGSYTSNVSDILGPLLDNGSDELLSRSSQAIVEAAHDVYSWSLTIAAKTHRAISSFEFEKEEEIETDPVQTDANGSAKVARVTIAQSTAAWSVIAESGVLDLGLVRYLVTELASLDRELSERFPLAMAFVRPGFDETIPGSVAPWSVAPAEEEGEQDDE